MSLPLSLEDMTTAQKLQAMETLWTDLSKNASNIPIPSWHTTLLQEREQAVDNGTESFLDWSYAKKILRSHNK